MSKELNNRENSARNQSEQFARNVVLQLRDAGFQALFAGGCVRDRLLGVDPKDFDVATSALPNQVRQVFGHGRTIAIGASFGVITVLGPKPEQVEVATFRSDGNYSDGRHPDSIVFSSPEEDAQRRDFTINGMFYDPIEDRIVDYVGGQADLVAKQIRAIGSPMDRIEEDRLRMLRAVRFSATFEFEIESATLGAIRELHSNIVSVSQERITHELQRMLLHSNRQLALKLLVETELLCDLLPDLNQLATSTPDIWQQLLRQLEQLASPDLAVVLSVLFGFDGTNYSQKQVEQACRKMKLSNDVRKRTRWLVEQHAVLHDAIMSDSQSIKFSQLQPILVHEDVEHLLSMAESVALADGKSTDLIDHCREKLNLPSDELNPEPILRGEDLGTLEIRPGPAFAKMLQAMRNAQLDGEITSKDQALNLLRQQIADGVW